MPKTVLRPSEGESTRLYIYESHYWLKRGITAGQVQVTEDESKVFLNGELVLQRQTQMLLTLP